MNSIQNNLCIIPARGGSKRILRKNVKNFLGKPIIAYSIEAALNSGLFSEVMVSTDDEEIAEIAVKYGAVVPYYRSEENSSDYATTMDVLVEVTQKYKEAGLRFDIVCCIYPTAPFVTAVTLQRSLSVMAQNNFDSLLPVLRYSFPIQRSLSVEDGRVKFNYPENASVRSQDLQSAFHDAGQFYWIKENHINSGASLITNNSGGFEISELEGQDIDNEVDWKLAELKYELLQNSK